MVPGVWTGVGFSNLKNFRTLIRVQKCWNRSGVGVWKSDSSHHCSQVEFLTFSYHWWSLVAIKLFFVLFGMTNIMQILDFLQCMQWRNWQGTEGRFAPTGKLNVKNRIPLSLYFGFNTLLLFSRLLFFAFFGVFFGDLELQYSHPRLHSQSFLAFFLIGS